MTSAARSTQCVSEALERRQLLSAVPAQGAAELAHTTAALSHARQILAAASVGTKALFAGGETGGFDVTDEVEAYDASTAQWSAIGKLSQARDHLSGVTVGTKVLFAGGIGPGASETTADIYDGVTGTWTSARLRHRRIKPAAVAVGDKALFVGSASPETNADGRTADIFDARTGKWSAARVPLPCSDSAGAVVGNTALFPANGGIDVYDGAKGRWSKMAVPDGLNISAPAVALGSKAIFAGVFSASDVGFVVYDAVTGVWSKASVPGSVDYPPFTATVVGTKALFAGNGTDVVYVYDAATDQWSTTTLSQARHFTAATTVGEQAIFAGGAEGADVYSASVNTVDIYTDAAPAAVLSGALIARAGHAIAVTVFNTGDADLAAGSTVAIYASASRALDANSILIGQATLADPLAAGSSVQTKVSTSLEGLAPSQYHLVAAVDDHSGSGPTPIASQATTFNVAAHTADSPASRSAAHPFALRAAPLHGWPVGG